MVIDIWFGRFVASGEEDWRSDDERFAMRYCWGVGFVGGRKGGCGFGDTETLGFRSGGGGGGCVVVVDVVIVVVVGECS